MTDAPGWEVLSSRALLKDRWLDLRADRCVTATGAELDPYYVLSYPDWVNVVALTAEGGLVMVRQYRHGIGETVLELPGGMMDDAEDAAATALRELREETGYAVDEARLICTYPANPATHTNRIHTYLATGARRVSDAEPEAGEDLSVHVMAVRDVMRELRAGRFGQSMQVGPLLLALEAAGRLSFDPAG